MKNNIEYLSRGNYIYLTKHICDEGLGLKQLMIESSSYIISSNYEERFNKIANFFK